jgi:hypothetical protein
MSIHRDSVVYTDPTNARNVLSANPPYNDGACYGTVSVTHGADFRNGFYDNHGTIQSVCVKPGEELAVLAALGDQLRGVRSDDSDNKTVVGTVAALKTFADNLKLTEDQTAALISRFTAAPVKDQLV